MRLLIHWLISAVALMIVAYIVPGFKVKDLIAALIAAAVIGLINATLGLVLKILTFPLTSLTLGLFLIVVNALLLEITDAITGDLTIDSFFWDAIWASIIMSIATVILEYSFGSVSGRGRR